MKSDRNFIFWHIIEVDVSNFKISDRFTYEGTKVSGYRISGCRIS